MSMYPFNEEEDARFKALEASHTTDAAAIAVNAAAIATNVTAIGLVGNGTLSLAAANVETSTADASALSISKLESIISAAGAQSRTLAAPSADGQLKLIRMSVHGGDCTLASTNIDGGTGTFTFNAVGAYLVLLSVAGKWRKLAGLVSA